MDLFELYNDQYDYLAVSQLFGGNRKPILAGRRPENVRKFGEGRKDAFFALNPMRPYCNGKFVAWKREEKNVASLKYLYMDMDTSELFPDVPPEHILNLLYIEGILGPLVPEPTGVLYSGRGFWLLWAIDEHIKALPRWKRVQNRIYQILKDYGADGRIINDPSRLCRIPGSINSKNGSIVEYVPGSDHVYSLYEMLEYLPEQEYEKKQTYPSRHLVSNAFLGKRARDLAYILRNHRDFVGYREVILFLYRSTLLSAGMDKEEALAATLELNASIENPLTEREVIRATKSAERREYKFTNKRIVDWLGLDRDEFDGLYSIATPRSKRTHTQRRNKRNYEERRKAAGCKLNDERMADIRGRMLVLIKQGLSPKQIQSELKISRSTYYNYKRQLGMVVVDIRCTGMHRMSSKTLINTGSSGSPKNSAPILNVRSTVVELTLGHTVEAVREVAAAAKSGAVWLPDGGGGGGKLLDTG